MAAPADQGSAPRAITLLGSTGALGSLAFAEAAAHPGLLRITGLGAAARMEALARQALEVRRLWGVLPALAVPGKGAAAELLHHLTTMTYPEVASPRTGVPGAGTPGAGAPGAGEYQASYPGTGGSQAGYPGAGAPGADAPGAGAPGVPHPEIHMGPAGLALLAASDSAELVLCAISGLAAWPAVEAAARAGRQLLVASKEVLVVAGAALERLAREQGGALLPLDSELSAASTLLARHCPGSLRRSAPKGLGADQEPGYLPDPVEGESQVSELGSGYRLLLTASGGPLGTWEPGALATATPQDALRHPIWPLGPKIAVDSATLINKAHEVVVASQLFGLPGSAISVAIHPQARIHAVLGLPDGSEIAMAAPPDMRLTLRALLGLPSPAPAPTWCMAGTLSLMEPDATRFPGVTLGHAALRSGAGGRAALVGANEAAVTAFLAGGLPFPDIASTVATAIHEAPPCGESLGELRQAAEALRDKWRHRLCARCHV